MIPVRKFLLLFALLGPLALAWADAPAQAGANEFSLDRIPGGKAAIVAVGFFLGLGVLSAVFLRRRQQEQTLAPPSLSEHVTKPQAWTPTTAAGQADSAQPTALEPALVEPTVVPPSAPIAAIVEPAPFETTAAEAAALEAAPESATSETDLADTSQTTAEPTPAAPPVTNSQPEAAPADRAKLTTVTGLLPYRENAMTQDPSLIMEVAEMMTLFGWPKSAAKTLVAYIDSSPHHTLEPSLKLLEVYRSAGMRTEYDILAGRLNQSFNVAIPSWREENDTHHQSLEHYPHILARISASWGRPECLTYLRRLLQDNRSGCRVGFPLGVLHELLLLESVLESRKELPLAA